MSYTTSQGRHPFRRGAPLQSSIFGRARRCASSHQEGGSELSPPCACQTWHQGGSRRTEPTPKLHVALAVPKCSFEPKLTRDMPIRVSRCSAARHDTTGPDLLFVAQMLGAAPAILDLRWQLHGLAAMQALLIPVNIAEERPDKNVLATQSSIQYYSSRVSLTCTSACGHQEERRQ